MAWRHQTPGRSNRRTGGGGRSTDDYDRAHRSRSHPSWAPDRSRTPRPGVVTPLRRAGYHLFGPGFDYLLHTRPAEWPIMLAHTLVGYVLAVGLQGALHGEHVGRAGLGLMLWVACLNGGTLALNSAYDKDEGDIAYLR